MISPVAFKKLIALSAVFAFSVLGIPTLQADPITAISGGNLDGPSTGGGAGSNFSFDGAFAVVSATNPSSGLVGTHVNPQNVDLGSFTSNGGPVTLAATNAGSQTLSFDSGDIVFAYNNPGSLTTGMSNTGVITDTLTLLTNTSGFNLGPLGGTWSLVEAYTGIGITPGGGGGSFTVPGGTSTASFTLNYLPAPSGVPEPTSLALWSVLGLVSVWYGRRKLQRKLAV
ncbi:MAG: hypothetical protein ACRELG_20895 [Gemmataceae bacterium]